MHSNASSFCADSDDGGNKTQTSMEWLLRNKNTDDGHITKC